MSLNYGFGYGSSDNTEGDKKYEALSKEDKEFYHQDLPSLLLITDIGLITEESIPHIIARLRIYEPSNTSITKEYLRTFIGFKSNICTSTNQEFMRKVGNRLPKMGKKERKAIDPRWGY